MKLHHAAALALDDFLRSIEEALRNNIELIWRPGKLLQVNFGDWLGLTIILLTVAVVLVVGVALLRGENPVTLLKELEKVFQSLPAK